LLAAVASLGVGLSGGSFGLHERVVAALTALGPFAVAVGVWWSGGHRVGSRRLRHGLAALVLVVGCVLAGVAATALAPATAHTRTYQATVSLDADPAHVGRIVAETTFGDARVGFSGLAPGIRAVPQVRASIADVLARPQLSLASLRPGPGELDAAVREVATRLLGRFALGALLLVVVVLAVAGGARRRRPPRWLVGAAAASWLVATVGTSAAIYTTYQPSRQQSFTATEVLGTLQRNQGLLGDVETRATQVTPYLRNLLALSTALQQKYAAGALESDPALRVLLVSDVHGGNQYPLMRTVVRDQSIDVVVDTGDLVNFGTAEEGEAAGVFDGIASLGVPYLFVRGNHDATSAGDTALLRRMARVPNVVLLQPPGGGYTEVTVGGVRIAGFDDPRWFGDSGTGTRAAQLPARDAFRAAFAGRTPPDVVASHEPWALAGVEGGVLLNGHMHVSDLEGNRIQVGTFTGGGPFSHFVADDATTSGELEGQGSAFDVLTFGTDCRLSSLTRYRFHDVLEGRPSYDDVSIVNGSGIDTRPADPGRTCTPGGALEQEAVTAPAGPGAP
ncbi:metallophosphoesterase family protein, partial [Phycicoccus flavus]